MAEQDAPRPALDAAGLRHIADVLRARTQGAQLWVHRDGADVVTVTDDRPGASLRLRVARCVDQAQADRDLTALGLLWNEADALLAAATERAALANLLLGTSYGEPCPALALLRLADERLVPMRRPPGESTAETVGRWARFGVMDGARVLWLDAEAEHVHAALAPEEGTGNG